MSTIVCEPKWTPHSERGGSNFGEDPGEYRTWGYYNSVSLVVCRPCGRALSDASVVSVTPTTVSWSVTPVSSTAYSLTDVTDSSLTSATAVSSSSSSSSSTVTQQSSDPPPPKYWDVQVSAAYLFMPTYCCMSSLLAVMRFFFFFFEMPPAYCYSDIFFFHFLSHFYCNCLLLIMFGRPALMGWCLVWQPAVVFICNVCCEFIWQISLFLFLSLSLCLSLSLSLIIIIIMDARSASVHVIFCRCFLKCFFL